MYDPTQPNDPDAQRLNRLLLFVSLPLFVLGMFLAHAVRAPSGREVDYAAQYASDAALVRTPDAGVPVPQEIPRRPAAWQQGPPCLSEADEFLIRGACYQRTGRAPNPNAKLPCGPLLTPHKGACYRPVAKGERPSTSIQR